MSAKQKVLIVDDEPRNQRIVAETLEDLVELRIAATGEAALTELDTFRPDLILLDIMMPGIDGYEVCKRIRARADLALAKVVLVSGKAMVEERLQGYAVGADDYMTKPFVPEELLAKAQVFLRLARMERELSEMNATLEVKIEERTKQLFDAEAKLITTAKMSALGEMAGGVAHEINTPLGTITLIISQLEKMIPGENLNREKALQLLTVVTDTVRRIGSIVQGLRTFSRDGSSDPRTVVTVRQILQNTLVLCQEKLKHAAVEVRMAPVSESLELHCRATQVSQVILNLVSNACDAVSPLPEKWLEVTVATKGDQIEIGVADSGTGIPESVRAKIFQPFFTTKEIGKGTGLGLSISKGIIESHGGTLEYDTASKNTRFVILMPSAAAQLAKAG